MAKAPCAFTRMLSKGAGLRYGPKLEQAFHTLPPPAAGTSGLVTLLRRTLPEGFLFLSTRPERQRRRGSRTGRPPRVSGSHPNLLRIGPFTELGGGDGAAVGLGAAGPLCQETATEKWLTQLQHGARRSGGQGSEGVSGRKRGSVASRCQVARQLKSEESRESQIPLQLAQRATLLGLTFSICRLGVFRNSQGTSRASGG